MSPSELVDLFVKYNLIADNEKTKAKAIKFLNEDEEPAINALELLAEYVYKRMLQINYGDCDADCVVEEFVGNFDQVKKLSKNKVKAQKLSVSPAVGNAVDHNQQIEITFDWNSKPYHFSFSKCEPSAFIDGFAQWVFEALEGDFLFIRGDLFFGYLIPKELINELAAIGLKNDAA